MKNINRIITSESQQINLLIKIIAFFWFFTKIWTYKTWITDRLYPVIPAFDFLQNVPGILHIVLFVISLALLFIICIIKRNLSVMIFFIIIELMSCLLDTVRWQPWEYMYLCMFLIININFRKPENILLLIHLLLVSMYFFSGLHKLNRDFLNNIWTDMILINFLGCSMDFILKYKLYLLGLIIPFSEIFLAVMLIFSKNKMPVSLFPVTMHLGILIILGPFGLAHNSVVWFWNLALIFILIILYHNSIKSHNVKSFIFSNSYWLILWFIMPIFSFFGKWYQYFSYNLYSGKGEQLSICISSDVKMKTEFGNITFDQNQPCINLQNWALEEIKSAPIPEIEIYKKISDEMKRKYGKSNIKVILKNSGNQKEIEL